jgi:hypothetical protein
VCQRLFKGKYLFLRQRQNCPQSKFGSSEVLKWFRSGETARVRKGQKVRHVDGSKAKMSEGL